MKTELTLEDLLPIQYDDLVREMTGKVLHPAQKKEFLPAIARSLMISASFDDKPLSSERITDNPSVIQTENGFQTTVVAESEIISRLMASTGISRIYCALALAIIEVRLATFIHESKDKQVFIPQIGQIRFASKLQSQSANIEYRDNEVQVLLDEFRHDVESLQKRDSARILARDINLWIRSITSRLVKAKSEMIGAAYQDSLNEQILSENNDPIGYYIEMPEEFFEDRIEVIQTKYDSSS